MLGQVLGQISLKVFMVQQKYLQLFKYQHPPIPIYSFNFMFKQLVAIQGHLNANSLIESSLPKYFSHEDNFSDFPREKLLMIIKTYTYILKSFAIKISR